ncbi:MAG: hypothetical protein ABMA26_07415, partial [Limisphaerales bacterium]
MTLRAAMVSSARARLARLEALAARLETRGAVAELRPVLEEIGELEVGIAFVSHALPQSEKD